MKPLPLSALRDLPPADAGAAALLRAELARDCRKLVVLDDDPTGVQTVHDVSVYTRWRPGDLLAAFRERNKVFYILTNSRAMTPEETTAIHREIADAAAYAARETGKPYLYLSRSDSTLRGHYPLETRLLREALEAAGTAVDGEILCPFFPEGGRYTLHGVHYVRQGETLVPAAETEFARDKTFGYAHSYLPDYIEEKTGGACRAADVTVLDIELLRSGRYDELEARLLAVRDFGKVVVDAAAYEDLEAFAVALYRAMGKGKTFLFRTAAGLVKVLGGIPDRPLLTRAELVSRETGRGGVVVVGSHTRKTTAQLEALLRLDNLAPIAFDSDKVLEGQAALDAEVARCVALEEAAMDAGKTAVVYTCRKLLTLEGDTRESALRRSVQISDAVQQLVGRLRGTPAFVIAKGGITSSDVGTRALGVRRATVLGQIRPGIPVWKTGPESKFPGVPYVIFPGNAGDEEDLRRAVEVFWS